ncbi:MAG: hypothetical protein LBE12_07080 [Planctomycetaceae bacterium]|nr:hypothetical protein [Planctomycetaceae bacterium]
MPEVLQGRECWQAEKVIGGLLAVIATQSSRQVLIVLICCNDIHATFSRSLPDVEQANQDFCIMNFRRNVVTQENQSCEFEQDGCGKPGTLINRASKDLP